MTNGTAVVIGANGGIGRALVDRIAGSGRFDAVHALSRTPGTVQGTVVEARIDIADADSIAEAAARIAGPVALLIVATGLLHEGERRPERSLRELDPDWMLHQYRVNAVGPALVLRHFAPKLPKDRRSVVACLSARVGSISDNRLGGWYGYRASKAALNQIVRTAAIEIARTHRHALCVALHPGTVATDLSAPFRGGVASDGLFTPDQSAEHLLAVLDSLTREDTGRIFAWDGSAIAP